jgi:hypothetical protein
MKIKGQYQWTDSLNAELLHIQPSGFRRIVQYGAYSFVALAFVSLLYMTFIEDPGIEFSYIFLLLFIMAFGFPILNRYVLQPNRARKNFAQQKELSLPFEVEFTEAGLNFSNDLGNSTRPWTYFTKWKENEEIMLLYQSNALVTMIPKRLFADPQQIETVQAFLEKNAVPKVKSRFRIKK